MSTQAYQAGKRPGWLTFAAVVMFAVGVVRVISGISYLADSNKIADLSGGLFGSDVFWWGIWDLGIAALALFAGFSLLQGHSFGRVVGYIFGAVMIVQGFLLIFWAPWYGAAAIVLGGLVIYGLAASEEWESDST